MDLKTEIRARREYFLLFAVFLVALALRLTTARYDLLLGADPWYHFKMANILLESGKYPMYEYYSRYPFGESVGSPPGLYYLPVFIYKIIGFTGISFFRTFQLLPAVFGSLTVVPIYFFIKELYNEKVGFITSLLLAISLASIERGLSGFYRGDVFMLFFMLWALYFFVRSLSKGVAFSFLTGFSMFLAGLFWNGWPIILVVLTVGTILGIAINYFKGNPAHRLIVFYGFASFSGLLLLYLFRYLFYRYEIPLQETGIFFTSFKLLFAVLLAMSLLEILNITQKRKSTRLLIPAVALLVAAGLAFKLGYFDYLAGLGRFKDTTKGVALMEVPTYVWRLGISEQRPVTLTYLTHTYNLPVLLAPIGAILVFRNFFALSYALVSLSFLIFQIRFTFIAAPVICLLAALVLNHALKKRRRLSAVFILLIILPNTYASINSSSAVEPLVTEDLSEALEWIEHNTPNDSVILSWWDYTGPIVSIANRRTVTHTAPSPIVEGTALMFRTSNETLALHIARNLKEGGDIKDTVDLILIDERIYLLWPRIQQFEPFYYRGVEVNNNMLSDSMLAKFFQKKNLEKFKLAYDKGGILIYQPLYNYTKITEMETDKRYYKAGEDMEVKIKTGSNEYSQVQLRLYLSSVSSNYTIDGTGLETISLSLPENLSLGTYPITAELYSPQMNKTHSMERSFIIIN